MYFFVLDFTIHNNVLLIASH